MSKYLKSFNKETQEWEIISTPDVSVIQQISGETISDTNIQVSEPHYLESGETTSNLTDELRGINEDISKLQSNVSWLAEHGGGGSGGGGGSSASFNIHVISPIVSEGKAYVNDDKVIVKFMITGGTSTDICKYSYTFDSKEATPYVEVLANKTISIELDLSNTGMTYHSLIINAINPYGMTILPYSFNIYKSTLKCYFDIETAGSYYENEIFYIMQNDRYGSMPFIIENGIEGATVTMSLNCGDKNMSKTFENVSAGLTHVNVSFWDFDFTPIPGEYYLLKITAQSIQGEHRAEVPEFLLRVCIINPSTLSINLGINGKGGSEEIKVQLDSNLIYNFRVFAPSNIIYTYYSAKIVNNGVSYLILGKYYDEETKIPGSTFNSNDYVAVKNMITEQYPISTNIFSIGDKPKLYVKVWDINHEENNAEIEKEFEIVASQTNIFARQYGTRTGTESHVGSGDTMIASWNRTNALSTSKNKWTSSINNYSPILSGVSSSVVIDMNVKNGNDKSGIQTDSGTPYLRLENHAYGEIDFSDYINEINTMLRTDDKNSQGCSISISVLPDIHTDTNHTLFLWGVNSGTDGKIVSGIKVDIDKIYWAINEKNSEGSIKSHTLTCPLVQNEITVITFSIVRNNENSSTVRIYKNGVVNTAIDIYQVDNSYTLPNKAYLGLDIINNNFTKFSDVKIYELSIYTKSLNDLENTINSKNARIIDNITSEAVIEDYKKWKINNLITASKTNDPISALFSNGKYISDFQVTKIQEIAAQSEIPVIYLTFDESGAKPYFTQEYFFKKYTTEVTAEEFKCTVNYCYKNDNSVKTVTFPGKVTLQGTTTLGYRVKNLELYVDDTVTIEGQEVTKLFQPIKEWFPESQFTLKADVVDSSHANNAVIGTWINNANEIFDNNPAMAAFSNETRPKEVDDQGNPQTHYSEIEKKDVGYDEDVKIKHTLEGFPILLFIKFAEKTVYDLIGIYSFNLGRYSYFNMGMKFLDCFSRYNGEGETAIKEACPKIINYYKTKQKLGTIDSSNVYSFEFGDAGNENVFEHPVWSQYETTVLQHYGEFKYPKNVQSGDEIWGKLQNLFLATAQSPVDTYYGESFDKFNEKYSYKFINGVYEKQGDKYIDQKSDYYENIDKHLNIKNAVSYFVVANAFGMFDSLGKNMTLRTWDGGKTWWTAFYDMDTALALVNSGAEDGPIDSSIDKVELITDVSGETSNIKTTYHYEDSKYAAYRSKLWGLLRCNGFLHYKQMTNTPYYETIWNTLRQSGGLLETSSKFTDLMEERIGKCGEMIYDYDYYNKYILDSKSSSGTATAAIDFLHGTRIDFVKDWLKKHFYYLDGMFDSNQIIGKTYNYSDSPYNSDKLVFVINYPNRENIKYIFQATTPSFIALTIGADERNTKKFYINEKNKDTIIFFRNSSSSNSQLTIKGSSLLSKIEGLQGGFMGISTTNAQGVAYSLSELDASNSLNLQNEPLGKDGKIISKITTNKNNLTSLESLKLNNTKLGDENNSYALDLQGMNKLLYIDISNSDVQTFVLPTSLIQSLNVKNSKITNFELKQQNSLTNVDLTGCNNITTINLQECSNLKIIDITNKQSTTSFNCIKCSSIESININNCPMLETINITNNENLKEIVINKCSNKLQVNISSCGNLKRIVYTEMEPSTPINIDNSSITKVEEINIDNSVNFLGFKIDGVDTPTYEGKPLLDFSKFTNLNKLSIKRHTTNYVKVKNVENSPLKITSSDLSGCEDLIRIFGHIGLNSSGIFERKYNFYINEQNDSIKPEDEPTFNSINEYYTNITICTNDISNCFAYTSCKNSDVYYIFQRCANVNIISGLFQSIPTINISNLSNKLLYHCSNIRRMDYLFSGTNISSDDNTTSDTWIDKNFLEGHIDLNNMKSFNYVFGKSMKTICNTRYNIGRDNFFFPSGNAIEEINSFSIKALNPNDGGESYFKDTEILYNLPNLKVLRNSFNNCGIAFTNGKIFANNNQLTQIRDSFTSINSIDDDQTEDIKDLFGINAPNLINICNCFSFTKGNINIYIGNSFFNGIPNIKNILGGVTNESFDNLNISDHSIIYGDRVTKLINYDDCDGEKFPYKIFENLKDLVQFTGFFKGLTLDKNLQDEKDYYPHLPCAKGDPSKSIFNGMSNLYNFSYGFADMKLKYYLEPDGLKDCNKLAYIPNLFQDIHCNNNDNWKNNYGKQNTIPYHFLYNGEKNTIINMEKCFYNTNAAYISGYTCSDEVMEKYLYEDANDTINDFKYKWNPYISDNTIDFVNKFNTKFNQIKEVSGLTDTIMYSYYKDNIEYIVDTIEEIPSGITYIEVTCYTKNNERIFPYIIKEFKQGDIQNINASEIKEFLGAKESYKDQYAEMAVKTNYFCAPDVFNYCENSSDLNVTSCFCNASLIYSGQTEGANYIKGFKGKIPPMLFQKINNVFSLASVFGGCRNLFPYTWGGVQGSSSGITYPIELFNNLNNLTNISNNFSNSYVWNNTFINKQFIKPLEKTLTNISNLWAHSQWGTTGVLDNLIYQLPINTFSECTKLADISGIFSESNISIHSTHFNSGSNYNIINCSSFMANASGAKGDVPTLWTGFSKISNYKGAFSKLNSSYIGNYKDIPEDWK